MVFLGALLLAQNLQAQDANAVLLGSLVPGATLRVEDHRLVLEEAGKEPLPLRKPDDFQDTVRITTAAQALEFVRLLRAPGVWPLLFDKPALEIRHQPVLYRLPGLYDDLRIYTISGFDGVVNDADWKRLGVADPKVGGGSGKDWTVRRPCLTREGDRFKVGTLVERVSEKGHYVSTLERPEDSPRGVRWTITGKAPGR